MPNAQEFSLAIPSRDGDTSAVLRLHVAQKIRRELNRRGQSAIWLAHESGIDVSTVRRLLVGGKQWKLDYLEAICRVLAVHPGDIIDDRDDPRTDELTPEEMSDLRRLLKKLR